MLHIQFRVMKIVDSFTRDLFTINELALTLFQNVSTDIEYGYITELL